MTDFPPPDAVETHRSIPTMVRLAAAFGSGAVVGVIAALTAPWQTIPLLTWDGAAVFWMAAVWWRIACMDNVATSVHATRDDPRRATADALLLASSLISLVSVLLGVLKAGSSSGTEKAVLVAAVITTIVISWAVVHTLFTLRYADLYYKGPDGGIDFNEDEKPSYADFAYLAFTIGMTYQVSDTNLTSKDVRRMALRHAMLSYLFGTVIIAATINLASGLAR